MERLLPFARLTQLLKVIEQLPVPMNLYNRHRMEYDYILGQLCYHRLPIERKAEA